MAKVCRRSGHDESWYPGGALVTLVLVECVGKTTCTSTARYESKEARDGVLRSGMEAGIAESYDQLYQILASLPKTKGGR